LGRKSRKISKNGQKTQNKGVAYCEKRVNKVQKHEFWAAVVVCWGPRTRKGIASLLLFVYYTAILMI
jgi:hypothetical protein